MGATIKLYSAASNTTSKWLLNPEKLLVVDSIDDYLATFSPLSITDFQYIKNELELTINVDLSQTYAQPASNVNYKYLTIQNAGERMHYYFVKNHVWRSKTCIRFELLLDVLNTFKEGSDYSFKESTRIIREHKDRFVNGIDQIIIDPNTLPSITGTISEGDAVYLKSGLDNTIIFTGLFNNRTGTAWTIDVDASYYDDEEDIKAAITARLSYPFYLEKNASNYVTFNDMTLNFFSFTHKQFRRIDYEPEGINPILYHRPSEDEVIEHQESAVRTDWYLVYRNQLDPSEDAYIDNPVDCYLFPKEKVQVTSGSIIDGVINANNLETGVYYYINLEGHTITLSDGTTITESAGLNRAYAIIQKNDDGSLTISRYRYGITGSPPVILFTYSETYIDIEYITLDTLPYSYYKTATWIDQYAYNDIRNDDDWNGQWEEGEVVNYLDSIDDLDRSSAKLIKIIKLPYVPYIFNYVSHKLDIPNSDWEYVNLNGLYCLKLHSLNTNFHDEIDLSSDAESFNRLAPLTISAGLTTLKNSYYESKLFHSEFFAPTYVYDSFMMRIDLEKCDLEYYIENRTYTNVVMKFDVTKTINSRFMFTLANYQCKFTASNFYKMFTITRNNEDVLYNVPYVNYIRTGFNYDVKAKNASIASNYIGVGLSGVATIVGAVMNNPLALGIGLVSLAQSAKTAIINQYQQENSFQQKQEQIKEQTASAAGSDDVDLMSIYAQNRVIFMKYSPSEIMSKFIYNLLFYAGYSSARMGIPNHNTRVNFDYLECDASLETLAGGITKQCVEELINCFKAGVTYLHKTSRTSNKWDFEQKYENWEKWLVED